MSPDASYPIGSVYTFSDVVTLLALYCCAVSFSPENLPDTGFPHGMQHTLGLYARLHFVELHLLHEIATIPVAHRLHHKQHGEESSIHCAVDMKDQPHGTTDF